MRNYILYQHNLHWLDSIIDVVLIKGPVDTEETQILKPWWEFLLSYDLVLWTYLCFLNIHMLKC